MVLMVLFVSSKTIMAQPLDASIGNITELNGVGRVVRNEPYKLLYRLV